MSTNTIWTPGLKIIDVSRVVEEIRERTAILQKFPVDIDSFIEFELNIELIPYPDLHGKIGAEAMISMDYTSIYVDSAAYMDESRLNRIKFSIAHELGHYYLHKDFFVKQKIRTEEDWISLMLQIKLKYVFLENHANWFAGILLVPAEELFNVIKNNHCKSLSELTRYFGVSQGVIKKRLEAPDVQELLP